MVTIIHSSCTSPETETDPGTPIFFRSILLKCMRSQGEHFKNRILLSVSRRKYEFMNHWQQYNEHKTDGGQLTPFSDWSLDEKNTNRKNIKIHSTHQVSGNVKLTYPPKITHSTVTTLCSDLQACIIYSKGIDTLRYSPERFDLWPFLFSNGIQLVATSKYMSRQQSQTHIWAESNWPEQHVFGKKVTRPQRDNKQITQSKNQILTL